MINFVLPIVACTFTLVLGAYTSQNQTLSKFEETFGFPLSKMYEAKAKCEEVEGKGNCVIIGGAYPRPRPDIVVPTAPLPNGHES